MERPRLKANLTTKIGAADRVFLIAEDRHVVIQGRGPVAILPYLDGHHTIAQIAEAVGDELSLPETIGAIRKFQLFGRVADGYPDLPDDEIAYWDAAIVTAAKQMGCQTVYSEDLNSGQNYDGVTVINPFAGVMP